MPQPHPVSPSVLATKLGNKMARSASISHVGAEFDDFLFAPIGVDRNGMVISVLSALARLDVDPWEEAAKLARLPGEAATQKLAYLIAAQPDSPSARQDSRTIAARLLALLPRQATTKIESSESARRWNVVYGIFLYAVSLAFVLGTQYIVASRQPPTPAQMDKAHAPASRTAPQASPPSSGER